jgi:hypothetical protein
VAYAEAQNPRWISPPGILLFADIILFGLKPGELLSSL